MNKELDAYKEVIWLWNGDKCTLGELTNSQLKLIRQTIRKSDKKEFCNSPRGLILNAVNEIIQYRHNNPYETIVNTARERFSKRKYELAQNIANHVFSMYIKPHINTSKHEMV